MFSTSSFWFGLTTLFWKTSNTSKILQDLFWGRWEFSSKPESVSTSRNTFNIPKKPVGQDSGPIRISCVFTSPQMSSHGFVVVAPTDGDQKVLVHPKDGWINCQDLCALHLHSPSTWHQFWNQKMAEGACLGSRLDTWNGKNSLYLWEDCWEAHIYMNTNDEKLEDSSQKHIQEPSPLGSRAFIASLGFFRCIHLSPSTPFTGHVGPNPPSPSRRAAVILPSRGRGHLSRLTLRDDAFLPGRSGVVATKMGANSPVVKRGDLIWHLGFCRILKAMHSRLSIRYDIYIYIYIRV